MTSTFDGSTPTGADARPADEPDMMGPEDLGLSALDQLRERVATAAAEREEWVHEIPKVGVRITCDANIDAQDHQRWVATSMPRPPKGRGRPINPDPMKMRRDVLSARAILHQCVGIELRGADGKFRPMLSPTTQAPLVLEDQEFLRAFGVPDPIELMRRLFVRDADLIKAGQDLLRAAGYMDDDDDEDEPDPT